MGSIVVDIAVHRESNMVPVKSLCGQIILTLAPIARVR